MNSAILRIGHDANGRVLLALGTFSLYWAVFDLKTAIAIVSAIGFHELGHAFAARMVGIPVGGIILHPLGGSTLTAPIACPWHAVIVTAMGPSFSLFTVAAFAVIAQIVNSTFWIMAALLLCIGTLINLLPFGRKSDGARLADALFFADPDRWDTAIPRGKHRLGRCWYSGLIAANLGAAHGLAARLVSNIGGVA